VNNKYNPDPSKEVKWGAIRREEMMMAGSVMYAGAAAVRG